jgi:hypothetical protein
MVKFKHDLERNTYSWLYTGGCYKGGDPVNYEDAHPGEQKDFKDVQFEVRLDHREFHEIASIPEENDDDEENGQNANNSMTPEGTPPKKESESERKIRLKKE